MRCEQRTRSLEDFMNELLVKFVVAVLPAEKQLKIKCIPAGQTRAVYVSGKNYLSREFGCDQERRINLLEMYCMLYYHYVNRR